MKKKQIGRLLSLTVAAAAALTACAGGEGGQENIKKEAAVIGTWQAEDAQLKGNVKVESSKSGFTGEGYITGIQDDGL